MIHATPAPFRWPAGFDRTPMSQVQFYYLQRAIQDRFIESSRGKGAPTQLLYQPPGPNPWAVGLAATASVLFTGCAVFAFLGFGNLEHRLALNPVWTMLVYAALLCLAMATLLKAMLIWNRDALLPFRRGIHAFPAVVIDARSSMLEVHKISELAEVVSEGSTLRLRFADGATIEFRSVDATRVESIKEKFKDAQERLHAPPSETFGRDQALLDPLADSGFKSLFSPNEPMKPRSVAWGRFWPVIAVVVGLAARHWPLENPQRVERQTALHQSPSARHDARLPCLPWSWRHAQGCPRLVAATSRAA